MVERGYAIRLCFETGRVSLAIDAHDSRTTSCVGNSTER